MTAARDAEPLIAADAQEAITALRAAGLRMSTPRRRIIDALFAAEEPVSAAHLTALLALEESSVYRNLDTLERYGLVRHLHLGHSPGLYALAGRDEAEYLYCERCGRLTALAGDELAPIRVEIRRRFGLSPRFTHFALTGDCDGCVDAAG